MGCVTTISVCEAANDGWWVECMGRVILPVTTQGSAMLTALDQASRAFDRGVRAQVIVVPREGATSHAI